LMPRFRLSLLKRLKAAMTSERGLLLDTHVFLWWRADPQRLAQTVRQTIASTPLIYVSAASAWEVSIKISLGKLRLPQTFETGVEASGFNKLMITFAHAEASMHLPLHHRDPFDRLLVAQAKVEGLTLVTHDDQLKAYDVSMVRA